MPYDYTPLVEAEHLYNECQRSKELTAALQGAVRGICAKRNLTRATVASDLGFHPATFSNIVHGTYSSRTDDHVIKILRYCGIHEDRIADVLAYEPVSFRHLKYDDVAANEEIPFSFDYNEAEEQIESQLQADLADLEGDQVEWELDVDRGVGDTLKSIKTEPEVQAEIRELRNEDHTVYAPIHLGSWLQLQMDLLEEIPHAHLNAFIYKCVTRMSDIERYKVQRIIDDLRAQDKS